MAGTSWRLTVSQIPLIIEKRSPPCQPIWYTSGPCIGDGNSAFQNLSQSNCPDQSMFSRTDCRAQMPFTCSINDVTLDPNVATCGDCVSVAEGQSCYLVCVDAAASFTPLSLRSLLCLQTGFAPISQERAPQCVATAPSCPPILSWNGMATDHTAQCVGAFPGQVCRASCLPGYYSSNGWYDTTCTDKYTWSRQLSCECQGCGEFDDPSCATKTNYNDLNYKYI